MPFLRLVAFTLNRWSFFDACRHACKLNESTSFMSNGLVRVIEFHAARPSDIFGHTINDHLHANVIV